MEEATGHTMKVLKHAEKGVVVQTMEATVVGSESPCATRNKLQAIPVPGFYPSHSASRRAGLDVFGIYGGDKIPIPPPELRRGHPQSL